MKNKKGLEFSFGWLFALVVGAAIIFLAIYAAIKFIGSEQMVQETEAAKQLEKILTPIETGSEEANAAGPINFPAETRVYNNCSTDGSFGEQSIRVSTLFGGKWQEQGIPITSHNKYIFSPGLMQAKALYVFSKPFEMPFEVASLLFIWSDKYCFVKPSSDIEDEITELNLKNINITRNILDCGKGSNKGSKIVCNAYTNTDPDVCNITVDYALQTVTQKGIPVHYEGSLIYGAIFSEPDVYECQVKRLMKRTSELAKLYYDKSWLVAGRSSERCSSGLQPELTALALASGGLNNSFQLAGINGMAERLGEGQRGMTNCKLWGN